MRNLLSAECLRLRKSWLLFLVLIVGLFISLQVFQEERYEAGIAAESSVAWSMDEAFFQCTIVNAMLLCGFLPLHLGVDYSDGTLRNKLVTGHRRSTVYLSSLLTAFLATFFLVAVDIVFNAALGYFTHGRISMSSGQFALYLVAAVCCALAIASVYTTLCMLVPNRAFALAACIALFMLMISYMNGLEHVLRQPEIASDLIALVDGKPVFSDPYPNPLYVSGIKRTLYEFLFDFIPAGQGIQLSNLEADRVERFPALSLLFTLLTSGVGLLAFSRKNIK